VNKSSTTIKKTKTSVYLSENDENLLNEVLSSALEAKQKQINLPFFVKAFGYCTKKN
jgi:hypothetical protein